MDDSGTSLTTGPQGTRRLGPLGRVIRATLLVAIGGGIALGTWQRNDQAWPFAPMSQFAFAISSSDGEIHSRYLEATTVDGDRVRLDLSRGALGLQRAEIEGQLWSFTQQPSLLQAIAVLHSRRAPEAARLATVEVMDDISQVRAGVAGEPQTVTVVSWQVVEPANPPELP